MARKYVHTGDDPVNSHAKDEQIIAGVKLWMTCLNAGEKLKSGGSDKEIAQILHNAYVDNKKSKGREACDVVIFINNKFIDVYDHRSNEILLRFRMIDVKDVTRGLDRYSNVSVLVAKQSSETSYKAYVFFSKKTPTCFYDVTRRAFQLGFEAFQSQRTLGSLDEEIFDQNLDSDDGISRSRQLDIHSNEASFKNNSELCCNTDVELSEDELFDWRTEQTSLIHPSHNMAKFHKTPK